MDNKHHYDRQMKEPSNAEAYDFISEAFRNNVFRSIQRIGSINHREIGETIIPADLGNRDDILQILRICYTK